MSEEALRIAEEKKRETKGKGEKERYTHMNAELQGEKRKPSADQCKEIEENNRMGKTRDLFKEIRDNKGKFYVKMGTIKDINGMDLIEAEYTNKKWQEDTELYRKISMTQITTMV